MNAIIHTIKQVLNAPVTEPKQVCNYPNNYYGDQYCK